MFNQGGSHCVGIFADGGNDGIFGMNMMQDYDVIFDRANKRIGWVRECVHIRVWIYKEGVLVYRRMVRGYDVIVDRSTYTHCFVTDVIPSTISAYHCVHTAHTLHARYTHTRCTHTVHTHTRTTRTLHTPRLGRSATPRIHAASTTPASATGMGHAPY